MRELCEATTSSAAALIDRDGETVDYFSVDVDAYGVRVFAAECGLLLDSLSRSQVPNWPETTVVIVRSARFSFALATVAEGYALVLRLPRRSLTVSDRALAVARRRIYAESGLIPPLTARRPERWSRVDVQTAPGNRKKPVSVWFEERWCSLTILGRYRQTDLAERLIGFRARLDSGAEFGLVREPSGFWYAENLS